MERDGENEDITIWFQQFIRTELQRSYDQRFLLEVTGPFIFGKGNFELFTDEQGEWQIRPIAGWKPAGPKGIIGESLTPREEFEEQFGTITDDQWEWLKQFCLRNPVTGGS